jgi:hypothetical protein
LKWKTEAIAMAFLCFEMGLEKTGTKIKSNVQNSVIPINICINFKKLIEWFQLCFFSGISF